MPTYGTGAGRIQSPMTDVTGPTPPAAPNLAPEPFKPGVTRLILPQEVSAARAQRANDAAARRYADRPAPAAAPEPSPARRMVDAYQTLKTLGKGGR